MDISSTEDREDAVRDIAYHGRGELENRLMRERLKEINGVRARFRGTFERFGERTCGGYLKRMALLKTVTDLRDEDRYWYEGELRASSDMPWEKILK
jgi:hypothetical protein